MKTDLSSFKPIISSLGNESREFGRYYRRKPERSNHRDTSKPSTRELESLASLSNIQQILDPLRRLLKGSWFYIGAQYNRKWQLVLQCLGQALREEVLFLTHLAYMLAFAKYHPYPLVNPA